MKGKTEEAAWKLSEQDSNHRKKGKLSSAHTKAVRGGPVNVPFYKIMEGTTIAVDAFKYGKIPNITAYFLSHAHADHYTRLSHTWEYGLIYCSQTTANLICHNLGVKKQWVRPLKNEEPTMVDGVKVTLLDANHCPGSSMFLFEGIKQPQGIPYRYLHCGDFRASPQMIRKLDNKKIDICYLDTTYLNPKYCFPAQEQVINACSDLFQMGTKADSLKTKDDSVLVLVGTYTIGKERIVKQIAKAIGSKIYCDTRKSLIFKCIVDDPELHQLMTDDPFKAQVHVTNLFAIKHEMLEEYLRRFRGHFTHIIGLRPTGWTYKPDEISTTVSGLTSIAKVLEMYATSNQSKHIPGGSNPLVNFNQTCLYPQRDSTERCQAFGVPYSEHSSFYELTCFCVSMDWVRIIPTVNCGSPASRAKMKSWFERWQVERKRRIEANLSTFIEPRTESYW
ncbi:hypothetical protein CROQUDRAFT_42137 [Cronartium quercuum f. sp. fusiforme G11]|uniref:DNA cross-link repair protein SNM1 n=1 Tax=Cronartium quercuum f. sp. fusiforme G11 TaxID=708437 RepID=A0A9P6NPN0_9BASI|nr:hypothetical protein CROQUDRAFT_42137 [Cronartium quercuum f. sp. fusiforme G11]